MSAGRYGQAFLDSLRENRPEEYASLQAAGELDSSAAEIEERAQSQYQTLLADLKRQHPTPKDAPYPSRVAHDSGLAEQARELVLAEVLVPSEDEATTE